MTRFGIYLTSGSVDGLNVGDKGEKKRGYVLLQIPWLDTW